MRTSFRFFALLAVALFFAVSPAYATNYAILVGVNIYRNDADGACKLDNLECCAKDMNDLKNALMKAKFTNDPQNIKLLTSETAIAPTRENILDAIREILRKTNTDDTLLFAFAGHGLALAEDGRLNDVLCCSDAKIVQFGRCEGILYRTELEHLLSDKSDASKQGQMLPERKIFIFDACRNVPGVEAQPGGRSIRSFGDSGDSTISQVQSGYSGIIRLASCRQGQVAHEKRGGLDNGVFTHFLIKALEGDADKKVNNGNGDGKISLIEMFTFASAKTHELVKEQQPTKTEIDVHYLTSDLILGTCDTEMEPTIQPKPAPVAQTPTTSYNRSQSTRNNGTRNTGTNSGNATRSGSGR